MLDVWKRRGILKKHEKAKKKEERLKKVDVGAGCVSEKEN